jgi:very-short-patch-repair endonuclease
MLIYNKKLKQYSRELRKNMTDVERLLWSKIRMRQLNGYQFYRQRIIQDYIVDFYCPRARLVIEVDGGQHYSGKVAKTDRKRDEDLRKLGLKVLRFADTDVLKNIDGVVETILENMEVREEHNPNYQKQTI